jgi:malonyl-CoA/methylmalonyl-CoA synthetase
MTLAQLFEESFTRRRDAVGLEWQGRELTFGEIDSRANRMARELAARGLRAGDRLAVYLANRLDIIDLFLACVRLGVIYVPINILYREREVDHILRDAGPRALVAAGTPPATEPVEWWGVDALAGDAAARDSAPIAAAPAAEDGTPAAIVYTSGTTGAAKGAVLTQGNLAANGRALVGAWRITSADRFLVALPLFHVHGLGNGLHCWLASGCRTRLLERFDHTTAAAEFLDFRPTLFFGVPTMYVRLLEVEADTAARIGRAMRLFVSGSAPLSSNVFEAFRARFGHAILERYGMTETLMTVGNPCDGERRAGTVGLPLPGVEVRIVDSEGRGVADGESGELLVRGPNVCAGYWRREEATRASFVDGWFRTGDIGVRSADGYYTLHGRRSDLIISGGFNIYPREIEDLLLEQPGVAEAAVVGAPDPLRGEVPVAYIVPRPAGASIDAAALEAACRATLASFKVPRTFVAVERLPRTALGKIQKHLLEAP